MSLIKKNIRHRSLGEEQALLTPRAQKIVSSILWCGLALFISVALWSYHYGDPSFIFESTASSATHNMLGTPGAYLASLLLYLFGFSAWLLPLICLYIIRVRLFNLAWKREIDRLCAMIFFLFTATGIAHFYSFDMYRGIYPGGVCGHITSELFHIFFSEPHQELFLFILTWATWVIIARFSCILYLYPLKKLLMRIPIRQAMYALWNGLKRLIPRRSTPVEISESAPEEASSSFDQLLNEFKEIQQSHMHTENETIEPAVKIPQKKKRKVEVGKISAESDVISYHLPSSELFAPIKEKENDAALKARSEERAKALEEKLERFGIKGKIVSITQGPVVTLFEYQQSIDTRISTIVAREDDLALALQAMSLRILAPIPGRSVVGFEVAHAKRKPVLFSQILKSKAYMSFKGLLPLILGKDTLGKNIVIDLAAMPHLLVAGSTGSGKSVGLHSMITSLLCCKTPDEVKLILIDPKKLEFSAYADVAHLLFPIVTDPRRAILVLKWAIETMDDRYAMMAESGVRNAADSNKKYSPTDEEFMPLIVIVIDELADLMMTAGKDVEFLITRLAQMARAAGIHLIAATQRPSVDVITGLIKVNFPSRIAYKVTSKVDSRTILDMIGAEKLLGKGDMLFLDTKGLVQRVHGAYLTDNEINTVINHIKAERQVEYNELASIKKIETDQETDDLFQDILEYIKNKDEISISLLQRVFRVGYNRSARIIDQLETTGYILPADGSKMRKVTKEH